MNLIPENCRFFLREVVHGIVSSSVAVYEAVEVQHAQHDGKPVSHP